MNAIDKLFAGLSVASGVAMIALPDPMARLYALPLRRSWIRALGARDVLIGGLFLGGRVRMGYFARSAGDALDVGLLLKQLAARPHWWPRILPRAILGALSSHAAYKRALAA